MDRELMKLAEEQINRGVSRTELTRIRKQMRSNPELLRLASKLMKKLRPVDIKIGTEQLKHKTPEDVTEIAKKMANLSREDIAAINAHLDALV